MRKFIIAGALLVACCGIAWAVADTTVTITDPSGKPIPEGTVTLTRPDKKPAPQPKTATTNQSGQVTVSHDEKDKNDNALIIITVTTKDGKRYTRQLTLKTLLGGGMIGLNSQVRTPSQQTSRSAPRTSSTPATPPTAPGYEISTQLASSPWSISLSGGPAWTRYSGHYTSTGIQAADNHKSRATGGELCGGVNGYWPIGGPSWQYGGGVTYCQDFTGKTTVEDIIRHGLTGRVTGTIDPGPRVELYVGAHYEVPEGYLYMRVGPNFAYNKLTITSDQVPGGGRLETASNDFWATGLGLQGGYAWRVCGNCFFGLPVSANVGGKFAWYPGSHSVDVTSSVFGFRETVSVNHVTQYAANFGLSVPLNLMRRNIVP
jgi:hypothetical protein